MPDTAKISRSARPGSRSHRKISPLLHPLPNAPKSKPRGRTKRFGSQARAGKTAHSAAAKSRKIRDLRTASETVALQSRRPVPGLCALSPAGMSAASKQNAEKYVQNAAAHQKTASKYPQKRLIEQWRKKQIIISKTILIYTGADA